MGLPPLGVHGVVIALVLVALRPQVASATPIVLTAVDDARGVDSFFGPPEQVFALLPDPGANTIVLTSPFEERLGIEFSLAPVPAGSTVLAASLLLDVSFFSQPFSGAVHGYIGDGVVQGTDLVTENLLANFSVIGPGALSIAIPSAFPQAALDDGDLFVGFALRAIVMNSLTEITSLDCVGCTSRYPRLQLDVEGVVVPEPGTLALVGVGFAAFAARHSRRKSAADTISAGETGTPTGTVANSHYEAFRQRRL
jgi:PEP-CTERM motif